MKKTKALRRYGIMTAGAFLTACGSVLFMIPNDIAPAGFTGISSIIHYFTGAPVGVFVFLLNVPFFFFAYKEYGKTFFIHTLYALAMYSLFSDILPQTAVVTEPVLACVYGGLLYGFGIGFVLYGGGTTGGSELLAKLISKRARFMSIGTLVFVIDACILAAACFVFGIEETLYAVIALFASSKVIDFITGGPVTGKAYYIFSEKNDEIYEKIMSELERGGTFFFAEGAYLKKKEKVLLCIVHGSIEAVRLKDIVVEADKNAFIMCVPSSEVRGEGFGEKG